VRYEGLAVVPYDYAAIAAPGGLLFTAGACPLDEQGGVVAKGNHRAQAEKTIENLLTVLEGHDAGPQHLIKTTIYVVGDRSDLVAVWDAVAARLNPYRPPSTLLGVAVLGYQDQLVEIEGIATVPG
jgi:enamine deaminase RidA (YjgF/YER057c/UK114 family)